MVVSLISSQFLKSHGCLYASLFMTLVALFVILAYKIPSPENRQPFLSVVVPTQIKYIENGCLEGTLRSFLALTKVPEEIVVVLSGTVNNPTIIEQFKAKWTRQLPTISFHLKPDAIQGPNRNKGAQLARGEFVSFFDGDDVAHPQRFEIIEKVLRQIPETDIVLTSYEKYDDTSARYQVGNSMPMSRYDDSDIKVNVNFDIVRETFVNVYEHQGMYGYWIWCCPLLTNFESVEPIAPISVLHAGWVTTRRNIILQHPQDLRETFAGFEDGKFLYDAARDGRANISILEVPLGAYYFRGSGVEKPGCVWPNSTRPSSRLLASEPSIIAVVLLLLLLLLLVVVGRRYGGRRRGRTA